ARAQHYLGSHRAQAEGPPPCLDAGHAAGADPQIPPRRDASPARLGREYVPVAQRVAQDGVGDVVGGQAEPLDLEQHLAVARWPGPSGQEPGNAEVPAVNLEAPNHAGAARSTHDRAGAARSTTLRTLD